MMDSHPTKFLVLEDDQWMRQMWDVILNSVDRSAEVHWVNTEEAAERLMRQSIATQHQFDCVLADVMLVGQKTGVDLWKRYGGHDALFIFVTGLLPHMVANMTAGCSYPKTVIHKPVDPTACADLIWSKLQDQKPNRRYANDSTQQ
jgi:FixJ family two-component response regulator